MHAQEHSARRPTQRPERRFRNMRGRGDEESAGPRIRIGIAANRGKGLVDDGLRQECQRAAAPGR